LDRKRPEFVVQPLYIYIEDRYTKKVTTYTFKKSPVRVGRNPMNDLQLPFSFVSQWHAIIRFDEDHAHYIDLGSTNGTLRDDERVPKNEMTPIGPKVKLSIWSLELTFSRSELDTSNDFSDQVTHVGAIPEARVAHIYPDIVEQGFSPEDVVNTQERCAIETTVEELRDNYDAYRLAWRQLQLELTRLIDSVDGAPRQAAAILLMQEQFPRLAQEANFRKVAQDVGAHLEMPEDSSTSSLARMANAFLLQNSSVTSSKDEERFAGRIATILEGFGAALVEMLRGYREFREQTGLQATRSPTGLLRCKDSREVLAYLLDWGEGADDRRQEMISVFADLMIHQVALVSGVVDGAKGMLGEISPMAIMSQDAAASGPSQKAGFLRSKHYWQLFTRRFEQLSQDDAQITRALFGREFARAYATVLGQQKEPDGGKGS
jgi:type VI secretion system protein ImpI